jgi:putative Mn2+ efflux pump MntP
MMALLDHFLQALEIVLGTVLLILVGVLVYRALTKRQRAIKRRLNEDGWR